jgi:hypothetical protein
LILNASATTAVAQFRPVPTENPAIGERYHVETAIAFWNPELKLIVSSESLGIPGDAVDLVNDLGIGQTMLRELRFVVRPATKHKFRFNYLPMKFEAEAVVEREFVFNGQRYRIGLPVNTSASLKTFRVGYEYDFIYRDRGFLGLLVDVKYTDVDVQLDSPIGEEFTSQVAPIPAIGVVGRAYVLPNVSVTGELSYFRIPDSLSEQFDGGGRYLDYDVYGTVNFTNNVGAQVGLRSLDAQYFQRFDNGHVNFKGWYFGAVARF